MQAFYAVGSSTAALRHLSGRSALCSFAYFDRTWNLDVAERLRARCTAMFLDSGAFTAWSKGKPIDLGEYVAFVAEHANNWDLFAALDDIEDPRASLANWHAMRAKLPELTARIVPVFHEGEPIEVLDEYLGHDAPAVGLGRTEGRRSKQKTLEFYDACFNRHPKARFHAFGCGERLLLEPYPFHSFDCSTWERDSTYGNKHGWPWCAVSKETRMAAYVEAFGTIRHVPTAQQTITDAIRLHRVQASEDELAVDADLDAE